jgi:hypothetical protein
MVWLLGNIRYCFAASIILVGFGCVRKVKKWLSATVAFFIKDLFDSFSILEWDEKSFYEAWKDHRSR